MTITAGRAVRYKTYSTGTATEEVDDENVSADKENNGGGGEFSTNPFHINLDTLDAAADKQYVKVKIVLKNNDLEFQDLSRTAPLRRIRGIAIEASDPQDIWFCQKPDNAIALRNNRSVLTFYLKRWQPSQTKVWARVH